MTAAKCREQGRAAGTTSGAAEEEAAPRRARETATSQVTPASEERAGGSLLALWMGSTRVLERSECFRGAAPRPACTS